MTDYAELTNAEINREIAGRLGYTDIQPAMGHVMIREHHGPYGIPPRGDMLAPLPNWAGSVDAALVLPVLGVRSGVSMDNILRDEFAVTIIGLVRGSGAYKNFRAHNKDLPRAICLAWLEYNDARREAVPA